MPLSECDVLLHDVYPFLQSVAIIATKQWISSSTFNNPKISPSILHKGIPIYPKPTIESLMGELDIFTQEWCFM